MAVEQQIQRAIGVHGLWKTRLRGTIESGKSDIDPATAARDDACDFGRWLHDPALPDPIRRSPRYARVKDLHARFHTCACTVLRKALAADRAGAEAELRPEGAFSAASAELTREMMAWLQEAKASGPRAA